MSTKNYCLQSPESTDNQKITSDYLNPFRKSETEIHHHCRAKFYPDINGNYSLAQIQKFSTPKFKEKGWEPVTSSKSSVRADERERGTPDGADISRATRRAKITAFDYIMCNPDLNAFVTFTYSPQAVSDKSSYEECYARLAVRLSNRVQRCDLKYVMVPEHTKVGDIHFHAIMNDYALRMERAFSPKSGRPLSHNGKPLFNITDWKYGFTSAELIPDSEGDRKAVAKYIFKYMGKQMGQKIGGRYVLCGGDLKRPIYQYGESETEFLPDTGAVYTRSVEIDSAGLTYDEWSFI